MFFEDDDVEEIQVELEDDQAERMRQLVEEGWFRSGGEFISYAIGRRFDETENIESDPTLDQRISEIKMIQSAAEDPVSKDFFIDTSHYAQRYARLANDHDGEEALGEIDSYMTELNIVLHNSYLHPGDIENFLDQTTKLMDDFWNFSEKENLGYEGVIDDYMDKYFGEHDMEDHLA